MSKPVIKADLYAAFLAEPQHKVAEIVHGDLVTHPRPAARQAAAATALAAELFGPFSRGKGGPGGWVKLGEPELRLDRHILVPDLGGASACRKRSKRWSLSATYRGDVEVRVPPFEVVEIELGALWER